jgi:hypothetical protein
MLEPGSRLAPQAAPDLDHLHDGESRVRRGELRYCEEKIVCVSQGLRGPEEVCRLLAQREETSMALLSEDYRGGA